MVILIAHGSPDPHWRASVEQLTAVLQADVGRGEVRLAYLGSTPPTLPDVVSDAVRAGVKRIRVLPLFLTERGHVARDIHPLLEQIRETHPLIDVELLPPVGQHPLFRELLHKIASQSAD